MRRAGRGWCSRAAPLSHSSVGFGLVGHLVTEIHATHARLSTVLLKPPPTHPKVANTGPWLAGTAMEVAAWLGLLRVPDGDEDTQRDILRNIEREGIDVEAMMGLTEANLKELGFRMGDRSKIRLAQRR